LSNRKGRPTRYRRDIARELPDLFQNGESVPEVCATLGIARSTFYEWVSRHDEFREAYEHGQMLAEAFWCRIGREAACSERRINTAAWIFTMKHRFHWTDRPKDENEELTPEDFARRVEQALEEMDLADSGEYYSESQRSEKTEERA
jgi:hypothetical protein